MLSVEVPLVRVRKGLKVAFKEQAPEPPALKVAKRTPGAQSLALAHRMVQAVERREAVDFSDLARQLGVSQARVSALVALTFLAPGIQEEVLEGGLGMAHLTIHHLLLIARIQSWEEQLIFWSKLRKISIVMIFCLGFSLIGFI